MDGHHMDGERNNKQQKERQMEDMPERKEPFVKAELCNFKNGAKVPGDQLVGRAALACGFGPGQVVAARGHFE